MRARSGRSNRLSPLSPAKANQNRYRELGRVVCLDKMRRARVCGAVMILTITVV
jgi:hypothetical protein